MFFNYMHCQSTRLSLSFSFYVVLSFQLNVEDEKLIKRSSDVKLWSKYRKTAWWEWRNLNQLDEKVMNVKQFIALALFQSPLTFFSVFINHVKIALADLLQ